MNLNLEFNTVHCDPAFSAGEAIPSAIRQVKIASSLKCAPRKDD